jgi:hypothetical protein
MATGELMADNMEGAESDRGRRVKLPLTALRWGRGSIGVQRSSILSARRIHYVTKWVVGVSPTNSPSQNSEDGPM